MAHVTQVLFAATPVGVLPTNGQRAQQQNLEASLMARWAKERKRRRRREAGLQTTFWFSLGSRAGRELEWHNFVASMSSKCESANVHSPNPLVAALARICRTVHQLCSLNPQSVLTISIRSASNKPQARKTADLGESNTALILLSPGSCSLQSAHKT